MKKWTLLFTLLLMAVGTAAQATISTFVSGSTGADGALNPSTNTIVTIPASGVMNYTTINVPAGITVTFLANALNTPIALLATGNVTIAGTISVNGGNATATAPGTGGPGGFGGGIAYNPYVVIGGSGLGPGGGQGAGPTTTPTTGGNGSYAGIGTGNSAPTTYGNINILPLIGGSGGGGGFNGFYQSFGGGGGGAILIASTGTITHTGTITAKGGGGFSAGGAGSAGAIKLMANNVTGSGTIDASSGTGGTGRTRIESFNLSFYGTSNPAFTYGIPGSVFGSAPPSIAITSIAGISAPAIPTGSFVAPDVSLPNTTVNPVPVTITATNIPVGTNFTIRVIPSGWKTTAVTNDLPVVTTTLSGTTAFSTGSANVTIPPTCSAIGLACTSVIVAQATFTVTAFNYNGEEIDQVRVARSSNGTSGLFYIAKSGKEIKVS